MYINNLGHMTKMAAMPIYGKNPSKIIFSETNRLISRKLGVRHRWLKYSNVYINHDPVMTLTKFMARSTWVACASELGKLLKCHLKEKANRKLANGQNIEDSEKRKWPKGLSAPALELNTIIFKHVYWYMQLISGERLQDHWSSGLCLYRPVCVRPVWKPHCWFSHEAAQMLVATFVVDCLSVKGEDIKHLFMHISTEHTVPLNVNIKKTCS